MEKLLGRDAAKAARHQTDVKLQSMKEALIDSLKSQNVSSKVDKYTKSNLCPYPDCKDKSTEGGFVEIDGNTANQKCYCVKCGRSWTNIYIINSIELHDPFKLKEPDDGD